MMIISFGYFVSIPSVLAVNTASISLVASSLQSLSIPNASQTGLDLSADFTLELYVKFSTLPSQVNFIDKFVGGTSGGYAFFWTANTLKVAIGDGTTGSASGVAWTPSTGTWYHITVSFDESTRDVKFYVDAVQQGTTQTHANDLADAGQDFYIGQDGAGSQYFDGLIDEVRIWSDIRTATEISDNYQKELTGSEANLVGYWKLNNDLLDETANNNDLTNNNSATFSTDVPFVGTTTKEEDLINIQIWGNW